MKNHNFVLLVWLISPILVIFNSCVFKINIFISLFNHFAKNCLFIGYSYVTQKIINSQTDTEINDYT